MSIRRLILALLPLTYSLHAFAEVYEFRYVDSNMKRHIENANVVPIDCRAILQKNPGAPSGIYTVGVMGGETEVYCDMVTQGGGWMLYNDYGSNTSRGAALNAVGINSLQDLSASGHVTYADYINGGGYYINESYLQFFYGDYTQGYIETALPDYGKEVMIGLSSEWYKGSTNVYIDNAMRYHKPGYQAATNFVTDYQIGDKIKVLEVDGITWIDAIWVR